MAGAAPRLGLQYGQDRIAFSASTSQIPSGKSRTAVLATASASRVLPTPPALTSETTRCASTSPPSGTGCATAAVCPCGSCSTIRWSATAMHRHGATICSAIPTRSPWGPSARARLNTPKRASTPPSIGQGSTERWPASPSPDLTLLSASCWKQASGLESSGPSARQTTRPSSTRSATSLRVATVLAAVGKGLKDDLARHPVAGLGCEGVPRICKRIDRADLRTKLPRVNHAS